MLCVSISLTLSHALSLFLSLASISIITCVCVCERKDCVCVCEWEREWERERGPLELILTQRASITTVYLSRGEVHNFLRKTKRKIIFNFRKIGVKFLKLNAQCVCWKGSQFLLEFSTSFSKSYESKFKLWYEQEGINFIKVKIITHPYMVFKMYVCMSWLCHQLSLEQKGRASWKQNEYGTQK